VRAAWAWDPNTVARTPSRVSPGFEVVSAIDELEYLHKNKGVIQKQINLEAYVSSTFLDKISHHIQMPEDDRTFDWCHLSELVKLAPSIDVSLHVLDEPPTLAQLSCFRGMVESSAIFGGASILLCHGIQKAIWLQI
jgi:hypothetical protein